MTILFAGGEDVSFTATGALNTNANTSFSRATYTRASLRVTNATAQDPPTNYFETPNFTASSTVWVHFQYNVTLLNVSNMQSLWLRSPDGLVRLIMRQTATNGQFKFSTRNAAGTITDLGTFTANLTNATQTAIDIRVVYGTSGTIDVWFDSVSVFSFSGDNTTNSTTQLYRLGYGSPANGTSNGISEVIVTDEDTRGMALWTLNPQAAGNTQAWTPNTLANINKAAISDATLISTSNNNDLSQWTTPTSAPSGNWDVKAIIQEARVRVGTTGPQHFDWSLRTASTDFTAGTSQAPTTSFGNFNNQIWATNPNTSTSWAVSDIASGFNLGIKSLA